MQSHTIQSRPWESVSADLFQQDGSKDLVLVDHYSDYFELEPLRNTSAVAVIRAIKRNFARQGIPDECVTDNGRSLSTMNTHVLHVNMDSTVSNHPPITVKEMEKRNLQS